ncbi:hypothetical protein SLEP1_g24463 [Rubroshorea leprosula]|uniref:Uncharacterized protein n=1 Tax=Rubroshorea leprosula TaxID=152421 RepID=A0AAV5JL30_9ROSI|nr:hypothetical protein SLEP1_g24463 [Rubroshorea leprosula]
MSKLEGLKRVEIWIRTGYFFFFLSSALRVFALLLLLTRQPLKPPHPPTPLPLRKTEIRICPALLLPSSALPCVGVSFSVFLWRESSSNFPPASPICSSSSLLANSGS